MKTNHLPIPHFNRLQRWANQISGFYGGPVCLVGSSLHTPDYRDVDVVCIIKDKHFEYRYGSVVKWIEEGSTGMWTKIRWDWSKDVIKKWEDGCKNTRVNLDFKVIPESYYKEFYGSYPILRIDENPEKFEILKVIKENEKQS